MTSEQHQQRRLRRVHARGRTARRRGPGAAVDRAGHADAGRHRLCAAQLRRALGRARALGLRRRPPAALRRGHREPRRPAPAQPVLVIGVPAGRRGCALAALSGRRPALSQAAHRRSRSTGGTPFAEDRAADVAPGARADRPAVRRGQGQRAAGGRLRPSRPVALHLPPLLGGGGDRSAAADRLDGPLPRRRRDARQPVAGAVADGLAAADARHGQGAGRRDRRARASTTSGCPGVWGQPETRMLDAIGTLGRVRSQRPVRAHRRRGHGARRHAAPPAAAVRRRGRGEAAGRVAYPTGNDSFPTQPAGARGDGRRGAAAALRRARGVRLVRHARGADRGADACAHADGRVALRVPARSRGARRRRPRAHARLVGVRTAGAGERLGRDRPRRRRDRLPDRHAGRREADRRVPRALVGPGRRRQPEGDVRLPLRLRVAARAVALGSTRRGSFRARTGSSASRWSSEAPARRGRVRRGRRASPRRARRRRVHAHAGRRDGVLVRALAYASEGGPRGDRARELRPGPARPARCSESGRGTSPGSASSTPARAPT